MPLFDHFRPPVSDALAWSTLHAGWASNLVEDLNENWLPDGFVAGERSYSGKHPEIDIATWEKPVVARAGTNSHGATSTTTAVYTVPEPDVTTALKDELPPETSIQIHGPNRTLVALVELVSPSNKDRPRERRRFATKVASYVLNGIAVAVIDVVTEKNFNLHDQIVEALELSEELRMPGRPPLYAVSYRPKAVDDAMSVDIWFRKLSVGVRLPSVPLRLTGDTFVPLELESTYMAACRKRRLL